MWIKITSDLTIWIRRLALYFGLYTLIMVSHLFFLRFDWWHTDVDSARYMLSALIQSEAAIVGLVVTLSLIAVQLAASSYSARVIEIFRKTPDLWILMGIYGVAIFYGLGVLKLIEKANPQANNLSNLESHISFLYYLGIFAFVALIPYILNTLELLKPSTVIKLLAERITKENLLSTLSELKKFENHPIQPIIDILRGSMMKYDEETVIIGLRAIGNRTNHIFKNETITSKEEDRLFKLIFPHLYSFIKLASKEGGDFMLKGILTEIIFNVKEIGQTVIQQNRPTATSWVIHFLGDIGKIAAEHKLDDATTWAARFLGNLGEIAAEHKLDDAVNEIARNLDKLQCISEEQKLKEAAYQSQISLTIVNELIKMNALKNIGR